MLWFRADFAGLKTSLLAKLLKHHQAHQLYSEGYPVTKIASITELHYPDPSF